MNESKWKRFICFNPGISSLVKGEEYILCKDNERDILVSAIHGETKYIEDIGTLMEKLRSDLRVVIRETRDIQLVGDETVVIREWDDMVESYGLTYGIIDCRFKFISDMKYLCGQIMDLSSMAADFDEDFYLKDGWSLSVDMFNIQEYNFTFGELY